MQKLLPQEIPPALTDAQLLALLYNWGCGLPQEHALCDTTDSTLPEIRQKLWHCATSSLTEKVYCVRKATPAAEIKTICEYCGLDWLAVREDIGKAAAEYEAKEKAKAKKGRTDPEPDSDETDSYDEDDEEEEEDE